MGQIYPPEGSPAIGQGLTFEKVWAALMEDREHIKTIGEQMKADTAQMKADTAQMKEQMRATDKRVGELANRFGDMVEHMVLPNLVTKFEELGFTFIKANRTEIKDRAHGIFMEIDALLENGDKVMAVEIKTKPNIDDIHDHIERMEKLRKFADLHNDKRAYLGAVAGVVFGEGVMTYALKKGFYVIQPSGDTFTITEPKDGCQPREW
jgi:hypothetical protein